MVRYVCFKLVGEKSFSVIIIMILEEASWKMKEIFRYRARLMPYEMLIHKFEVMDVNYSKSINKIISLCLKEVVLIKREWGWFRYEEDEQSYMIHKDWLIPMTVQELPSRVYMSALKGNGKIPSMAFIIRNNGVEVHGRDFWLDEYDYVRYGNHFCYETYEKAYKVLEKLMEHMI